MLLKLAMLSIIYNYNRVLSHCCLEGITDIRGEIDSKKAFIETGGNTTHGRWSYGSAQVMGMYNIIYAAVHAL